MTPEERAKLAVDSQDGEETRLVRKIAAQIREAVEAEAARWVMGAKISVPTETMEREFSAYYRRGRLVAEAQLAEAERKLAAEKARAEKVEKDAVATKRLLHRVSVVLSVGLKSENAAGTLNTVLTLFEQDRFQQALCEAEADICAALKKERGSARSDLKKIAKIVESRDDLYDLEEDTKAVLEGKDNG